METKETLGPDAARCLRHGSTLKGVESGNLYGIYYYEGTERPWVLEHWYSRKTWSSWTTREAMAKELATTHMVPVNMC